MEWKLRLKKRKKLIKWYGRSQKNPTKTPLECSTGHLFIIQQWDLTKHLLRQLCTDISPSYRNCHVTRYHHHHHHHHHHLEITILFFLSYFIKVINACLSHCNLTYDPQYLRASVASCLDCLCVILIFLVR
jgi:hypothetical protein